LGELPSKTIIFTFPTFSVTFPDIQASPWVARTPICKTPEVTPMKTDETGPLAYILRALRNLHPTLGLPALFDRMEGRT
jgi:hypothetical protein